MTRYVNVTGKVPLVPACPSHQNIALIPEKRQTLKGNTMTGFWRCPVDNKVYQEVPDGSPSPF